MMKYESGSSAESGCSRSDGPTDAEAERSRSATTRKLVDSAIAKWCIVYRTLVRAHAMNPEIDDALVKLHEAIEAFEPSKTGGQHDVDAPPPT